MSIFNKNGKQKAYGYHGDGNASQLAYVSSQTPQVTLVQAKVL